MDIPDQNLTPEAVLHLWDKLEWVLEVIDQGQRLPLHDRLRQSLQRVFEQVQHALNEGVELRAGELAILCVAEAIESVERTVELLSDYARTLFDLCQMMWF